MRVRPRAASCRATCRPIAPTPMTMAWQRASRSGGTSPRWRTSRPRIGVEVLFMAFKVLQEFLIEVGPLPRLRKGLPRTPLGGGVVRRLQDGQEAFLAVVNVGGKLHLPIGELLCHRKLRIGQDAWPARPVHVHGELHGGAGANVKG